MIESPKAGHEPIIQMEGVAVASMLNSRAPVVEAIQWSVHAGDYWVVAGLQGSGKTDFMMMTGGVMTPQAGCYRLFGEKMPIFDTDRLATRLRLGMVFAGGQLLNHLTVRENIALPLRYHRNLARGQGEAEVDALLAAMELEPWAHSTAGVLGRSWQQRAGLARALTLHPEILLVDAPLAGVDLRQANWWLTFLGKLSNGTALPFQNQRPMTLVVTTADLRPWKGCANQFALLADKRFVVLGDRDKLQAASKELLAEFLPN